MPNSTASAVRTVPAATVVVFRNSPAGGPPELLMVQRSQAMRFAGGAAVFPGGKIDNEDFALAAQLAPGDTEMAAKIAAIRETLEETGLAIGLSQPVSAAAAGQARTLLLEQKALAPVLDRFGWSLALERLIPFARWCPVWAGAFDTHFFLTDLGTGAVDIAVDATENSRLFWSSAANTLALADKDEVSVIFPTRRNLDRLAQFASYAEARAQAEAIPVQTISPKHQERDGEMWLTIPEGLGYPITGQPMATVKRG